MERFGGPLDAAVGLNGQFGDRTTLLLQFTRFLTIGHHRSGCHKNGLGSFLLISGCGGLVLEHPGRAHEKIFSQRKWCNRVVVSPIASVNPSDGRRSSRNRSECLYENPKKTDLRVHFT